MEAAEAREDEEGRWRGWWPGLEARERLDMELAAELGDADLDRDRYFSLLCSAS